MHVKLNLNSKLSRTCLKKMNGFEMNKDFLGMISRIIHKRIDKADFHGNNFASLFGGHNSDAQEVFVALLSGMFPGGALRTI